MAIRKYVAVCAHPDDMEYRLGGTLIKLAASGHQVHIICMTNGNAGHHVMSPADLAARRQAEAEQVKAVAGLASYQVWDIPDGCLEASLNNRLRLMTAIRGIAPDVVFTVRTCDYHPDHRAAAVLAQDVAYLITVPLYCPDMPVPHQAPVVLLTYDSFAKPCAFAPDIAVVIDDVVQHKARLLACHASQFLEWLPMDRGHFVPVMESEAQRLQWLQDNWLNDDRQQARAFGDLIANRYNVPAHRLPQFVETFELSEYGRQPTQEELTKLLPL